MVPDSAGWYLFFFFFWKFDFIDLWPEMCSGRVPNLELRRFFMDWALNWFSVRWMRWDHIFYTLLNHFSVPPNSAMSEKVFHVGTVGQGQINWFEQWLPKKARWTIEPAGRWFKFLLVNHVQFYIHTMFSNCFLY